MEQRAPAAVALRQKKTPIIAGAITKSPPEAMLETTVIRPGLNHANTIQAKSSTTMDI
jgi:hypothetical protein